VQGANSRQYTAASGQAAADHASPADVTTLQASPHAPAMPRYLAIKVSDAIQAEAARREDSGWSGTKKRVPAPRG
jgi:hypothetical protein